jgi:hypothetical protein
MVMFRFFGCKPNIILGTTIILLLVHILREYVVVEITWCFHIFCSLLPMDDLPTRRYEINFRRKYLL